MVYVHGGHHHHAAFPKKPKPAMTLQELRTKMETALSAEGKQNMKSELNTFIQILCKRPTAKGDMTVTHEKGLQEVLTMRIVPLNLEVCSMFEAGVKLGTDQKKEAELGLAESVISELVARIDAGTLEMPMEPLPLPNQPPGSWQELQRAAKQNEPAVRPEDYKSQLNAVLQKLLADPPTKDDRVFAVNLEVGYGSLKLPTLVPPVLVECGVMDLDGVVPGQAPGSAKFEHSLARMALDELTGRGDVVMEEDVNGVPTYRFAGSPGPVEPRRPAPANQTLRAPVRPSAAGRQLASARLKQWLATWTPEGQDYLSEQCVCQPDGNGQKTFEVNLSLACEAVTGGSLMCAVGHAFTREVAMEQAAELLMSQLDDVLGIVEPYQQPQVVAPPQRGVKRPASPGYMPARAPHKGFLSNLQNKGAGKGWGKW